MKSLKSIILWSCAVVSLVTSANSLFAQDSLRIAYVTSDRDSIMGFTAGKTKPDVILKSNVKVNFTHLAALAASADGQYLLFGGKMNFTKNTDGTKDSIQGFMRIKLPFTLTGFSNISGLRDTIHGIQILKEIPFESNYLKPLPLGVLTDDGQNWYGTWGKLGAAVLTFYRGKFDGSGTVDEVAITDSRNMEKGYHMTNLITSPDGKMMVTVAMDRLETQTAHLERCQLIRWSPGPTGIQITDIGDQIFGLRGGAKNWNIDSAFSCVLRRKDATNAEIGLSPGLDAGNIAFYSFVYGGGSIGFGSPVGGILRSSIPSDVIFFCGWDGTNVAGESDDRETTTYMQRQNNGGDMMFTPSGDSTIFIVHEASPSNDRINPVKTGIWVNDLSTGQSTLLYNNQAKIERQPIFLTYRTYKAPKQGSIAFVPTDVNMIDSIFVNKDTTVIITMKEVTGRDVKINTPQFASGDANSFSIIASDVPSGGTLSKNASANFTIRFAPMRKGHLTSKLYVPFADSGPDSIRTLNFAGNAKDKPTGGSVNDVNAPSFNVTVTPNPFNSKTLVLIQGKGAGLAEFTITDVLGRNIPLHDNRDQKAILRPNIASYEIDAAAMGLIQGTYYIHIRSGDEIVTRQIVYVK